MAKASRLKLIKTNDEGETNSTVQLPVNMCMRILNAGERQYDERQATLIRDLLHLFAEVARIQYEKRTDDDAKQGKLISLQPQQIIMNPIKKAG